MSEKHYFLQWRPLAVYDLMQILDFIAEDSPLRAKIFVDELRTKASPLKNHPFLGRKGCVAGTRELIIHRHYILIYQVAGQYIDIVRVKHTAREF